MTEAEQYKAVAGIMKSLANQHFTRLRSMGASLEFEDLMGEAHIAYCKALEGFDPERGIKFSTYLYTAVSNRLVRFEGNVRDQLRNEQSADVEIGDEGGTTLLDMIASEGQSALDGMVTRQEVQMRLSGLSVNALQVLMLLEDTPPAVMRELKRQQAFSATCKREGFAAPAITLNVKFICDLLGLSDSTRRKVRQEINALLEAA